MEHLTVLTLFTILFVLESIALYCIKRHNLVSSATFIVLAMVCYSLIPLIISLILSKGHGIGTVNITWNVMSNVYGLLIGMLIFSEVINGTQWLGILLCFSGIGLILLGVKNNN